MFNAKMSINPKIYLNKLLTKFPVKNLVAILSTLGADDKKGGDFLACAGGLTRSLGV